MNCHRGVWVVTSDPTTAEAVKGALRADGRLSSEGVCETLADLVPRLESSPAPAVVVDIDPQPKHALSILEPIISRFPAKRFLVLSRDMPNDLVLEAMQIGSRHFLTKSAVPAQLGGVLHRLIPNGAEHGAQGSAVTFLSASGGSGATTLAVNLAHEIQALSGQPVLLVDFDTAYGGAARYLGLQGRFGLADVLSYNGPIDAQLISTTAAAHADRLHVLLSPATVNPSEPPALVWDRTSQAVSACRGAFPFCVFDAPRVPIDAAAQLARASAKTFLVFQQTVTGIRLAHELLTSLNARGVPPGQVIPLLNRYQRRGPLVSLEDVQKVLGCAPLERMSNDFKSAIRGLNYGEPLAKATPRSELRRDVERLARRIVEARSSNGSVKAGK